MMDAVRDGHITQDEMNDVKGKLAEFQSLSTAADTVMQDMARNYTALQTSKKPASGEAGLPGLAAGLNRRLAFKGGGATGFA